MADEKNSATLQVKGLARTVTDGLVLNMFRTYGPILRVKVDGFGGAHVVFEKKSNAYKAIPATNGAVLEGKPIAVAMVPKFGNSKKTCRGFVAGICRKGSACKYLHITDNGEGAASQPVSISKVKTNAVPAAPAPASEALVDAAIPAELQGLPANLVCRHFARSNCVLGASCKFAHIRGRNITSTRAPAPQVPEQMEITPVAPVAATAPVSKKRAAPAAPAAPVVAPVIAKRPCSYFASGLCKRGEQCLYSHDLPTPAPAAPAKKEKKVKTTTAPVATKALVPAPVTASTTQHKEDASRTCIECETPDIAVWQCAKCDDSLYCESCNTLVHKSKVMKSHERTKLPPLAPKVEIKNPTCDECEEEESSVKCDQCDVVLCVDCDASVHKFKSLRNHTRNVIVKPTATITTAAPMVVVAKPAAAAASVVQEPAVKKQKVSKTKAVESPVASVASSPAVPEIEYIESVPKYDLTSASESESSESEAEDQQQQEQEDEDETMDSDDDDEPPIVVNAFPPQSVTNVAPKVKQQKVTPAPPTPAPQVQDGDISSESSDDDDERPVVLAAPVRKAAVQPVAASATAPNPHEVSSESESSSDDEDAKPTPRSVPVVAAPKPAASAAESSSSSEEEASSSDEEEEVVAKPVVKAPVVKKAPAARAPAAPKANPNPNPGISTGSSHSLVKKIEAYAEAGETETLHLDANLNGFERLLAHDCAERLGLKHVSVGEGLERHITISRR